MRPFISYVAVVLVCGIGFPLVAEEKMEKVRLGDDKGVPFVEFFANLEGERPGKDECYTLYVFLAPQEAPALNTGVAQSGGAFQLFFDRPSEGVGYFGRMQDNKTSQFIGYMLTLPDKKNMLIREGAAVKLSLKGVLEETQEKLEWKRLGPKAKLSAAVAISRKDKVANQGFVRFASEVAVAEVDTPMTK